MSFLIIPSCRWTGMGELCVGQTHLFLILTSLAISILTSEPGTVPHPPLFYLSWGFGGMVVHKYFEHSLFIFFSKESYLLPRWLVTWCLYLAHAGNQLLHFVLPAFFNMSFILNPMCHASFFPEILSFLSPSFYILFFIPFYFLPLCFYSDSLPPFNLKFST